MEEDCSNLKEHGRRNRARQAVGSEACEGERREQMKDRINFNTEGTEQTDERAKEGAHMDKGRRVDWLAIELVSRHALRFHEGAELNDMHNLWLSFLGSSCLSHLWFPFFMVRSHREKVDNAGQPSDGGKRGSSRDSRRGTCPLLTWVTPLETAEKSGGARDSSALEDLMREVRVSMRLGPLLRTCSAKAFLRTNSLCRVCS